MSVSIDTIEFGRRNAFLSDLSEEDAPFTVNGVALGSGDVTVGQSGIKKLWPAEELRKAADSLEGRNLVVDHDNTAGGVVGEVTKAGYKEDVGILYEAELFDEDLAEKIDKGLLEVSIRGHHADVDEMEENEDGAKVVTGIRFDNLSIVPTGAAPSNSIEMGEAAELSAAELAEHAEMFDELQEVEPGMWVKSGDTRGITISAVENGEIEVDVYEESDGKWRSAGETEMMSVDSLDEWDVDEEEDIGAQKDEEDEEEASLAEKGDTVEWESSGGMAMGVVRDRKTDGCFNEEIDGDVEVCADEDDAVLLIEVDGDSGTMVAHKESTVSPVDSEEAAPVWKEGDLVQWQVEPQLFGKIVHVDEKRDVAMIDIHERMDGELTSTGFTITAGFSDIQKLDHGAGASGHAMDEDEEEEMAKSFDDYPEAAKENAQMALDAREETDNPNDCGTEAGWTRANQLASGESLSADTVKRMAQFNRHRKNSDMDEEEGEADCGWMMWKAWGGDEGVDWANRTVDQEELESDVPEDHRFESREDAEAMAEEMGIEGAHEMEFDGETMWVPGDTHDMYAEAVSEEEMSASEELQDYEMHTPDWSGTTESEWDSPDMEDFDTDDLEEIDDHFLISATGFPPENFGDLALPVVEPNGDLNVNALSAVKGGRGVSAVDGLASDMEEEIVDWVNQTASDEFDRDWGEEAARSEGEEGVVGEDISQDEIKEQSPERYPDFVDEDELQDDELIALLQQFINETEHSPDSELEAFVGWAQNRFSEGDVMDRVDPFLENEDATLEDTTMEVFISWANNNFSGTVELAARRRRKQTVDDADGGGPVDIALDLINKFLQGGEGRNERDSVDKMLGWLFSATGIPTETVDKFRTAAKVFLDEQGGVDSFDAVTVEQFRDWLLTRPNKQSPVAVQTGDDLRQWINKSEESELDSNKVISNMTEEIEEKLAELSEPVAVEQSDLEELQEKADQFEELNSNLEEIRERTELLDEVDREQVEELADADEPVVMESTRKEELTAEAEQIKNIYAAELAEESAFLSAEELADKFSMEQLREKYTEQIGEPEEELTSDPEPRSADPSEEELEEAAEEAEESETEELSESVQQKQSELKDKILGNTR